MPMTDGQVWCMAQQGDTLYIGGRFHTVGPPSGGFVVIDPATGSQLQGWPAVTGSVAAAAADGQGGWFIGGGFFAVGGVPRSYLAHVRSDGTLDAWNPSVDGPVGALTRVNSLLYLGGGFTSVGGQPHAGAAAVDVQTGAACSWSPAVDGSVGAIGVRRGTVYLQERFSHINVDRGWQVAAVDSATGQHTLWQTEYAYGLGPSCFALGDSAVFVGSRNGLTALDPTSGAVLPWSPPVNGSVTALATEDSTLFLGGSFTVVNGQARASLAALSTHTGQTTAWNPGADAEVDGLVLQDSTLFASGQFTEIGGVIRNGTAALDISTGAMRAWNPGATDPIQSLLNSSPKSIAASGMFGPGLARACENLAAVDLRTSEVLAWDPGTTGIVPTVYCMAIGGGRLYVGGWFDTVGGLSRPEVASLDLATGLVTDWRPFPNTEVGSVAVHDSTVYVGGAFTSVGGLPRHGIVAINASTGVPTSWAPDANAMVRAFAIRDSTVYCGGGFTVIGGLPRSGAAALSITTGVPTVWNPSCDGEVATLVLESNSAWLGGVFANAGGQPRNRAAQVDLATGAATPWACALSGTEVYAISQSSTGVYLGGQFGGVGDSSRTNACALDPASGFMLPWNPGPDQPVHALIAHGDTVIVGGEFAAIDWQYRHGLARLLPTETSAPVVTVLGPVGDATLAIGSTQRLAWGATDAVGVQSVDVYLSRTGPAGPWTLLAAGAPNTGGWDWNVTGPPVNGTAWLLVVARNYSGRLGSAIGGSAFSIATNPLAVGPAPAIGVSLSPPFPNPVRVRALVNYTLPRAGHVKLCLIDVQGRLASRMVDGEQTSGLHSAVLEVAGLTPGLYFARLQAPGADLKQRVVIVR